MNSILKLKIQLLLEEFVSYDKKAKTNCKPARTDIATRIDVPVAVGFPLVKFRIQLTRPRIVPKPVKAKPKGSSIEAILKSRR